MPPLLPRATVIASALRRHDRTNPLGDGRGVRLARRGANGSMKINKECTAQQTNPMAQTSSLRLLYRELTERVFVSCQRGFVPAKFTLAQKPKYSTTILPRES